MQYLVESSMNLEGGSGKQLLLGGQHTGLGAGVGQLTRVQALQGKHLQNTRVHVWRFKK